MESVTMVIDELGKREDKQEQIDIGEVLLSYEVALLEQGKELQAIKQRLAMLEYGVRQHVSNIETAHKL